MILKVGLTGGIASGKSTAASMLAQLGCTVVDADRIVSELYLPGRPGHEALVREYGPAILLPDGSVDRAQLSAIAFQSAEGAARLNALIHPLVIEEQLRLFRQEEARGRDAIFIVEATLLLESGGRERFDRIVVVDVQPEVQIERAVARGMDREDAQRRMSRQMPRDERLKAADYVIDNSGSPEELAEAVGAIYRQLTADLENAAAAALK